MLGTLTPWDVGMRFETDRIHVRHLGSPYPVVRWRDQWGRAGNTTGAESGRLARASSGSPDPEHRDARPCS